MNWEFHFRNFDTQAQWFGVYHEGCGGAPWHTGRPRCWDCTITNNPTGGDNSVYVPAGFVVDFEQWFKVILDGIEEVGDILMVVASEGEDVDAWKDAVSTAFNISTDAVTAALTNSNTDLATLMANSQNAFERSAASINRTTDEILQIGAEMGLSGFGFIAGPTYQGMIFNDNDTYNDNAGWTMLRSDPNGSVDHILNHAFIDQGHLVIYWNSQDSSGFWNSFS
jgi:hypothetical protein